MRAASLPGTPCASRPCWSACGSPEESPTIIRVKKMPIESTLAEFMKVASIPAGKPAARPASQLALPPPPKELGRYTVQVGASQDRAEAHRIEARARTSGLRPYVVEANLGAKGVWYRVRVGAFDTREAAERFRRDVDRELRGSAAVMPSH